ncbi:MAG: S8 family serine peptidase [Candidatus Competibacter sp.]|nr:S8 family serine peptidase [Candidatus Competibacter sp.]
MARVRSSVRWIGGLVLLALILSGWVLRTESASSGGTVSADVTAQVKVTFSGLRYNRTTQTYDTVATLTNTSSDPILAPLELHVASIAPNTVALANPTGTASDGHPFVAVPLPTGTLAPGATVTNVVLRFRNPGNVQFTFTHHIFGVLAAQNHTPIARAGLSQSVSVGETVTFDGSASSDFDGDTLAYTWSLIQKPQDSSAILSSPLAQQPTLVVDKPGHYVAQLIVNDGKVDSDSVTVTVIASTQDTTQDRLLPLGSYPGGVTLGETKNVIFSVRLVRASATTPTEVVLQEMDDTGAVVVNTLGLLHDDGVGGDLSAGDFVYSGIFTLTGGQKGKNLYRAKAEMPGAGEITSEVYPFEVTPFPVGFKPFNPLHVIEVPDSELQVQKATLAANSSSAFATKVVSDELLVIFKENATDKDVKTAVESIQGAIIGYLACAKAYQVKLKSTDLPSLMKAITDLTNNPKVLYANPNLIGTISGFPDDSKLKDQYGIAKIRADETWLIADRKQQEPIAIVDSGVDLTHPDLSGKIIQGHDYIDHDEIPQDENGHGTHVAGIAAALSNNHEGIAGVAWDSKILAIRIISADNNSSASSFAAAICEAADKGARVINISAGFYVSKAEIALVQPLEVIKAAANNAYKKNVLIVAAAGNKDTDIQHFPAALPYVMAIGSTDKSDKKSKFSNYGNWIDIAAPGEEIFSTFPTYQVTQSMFQFDPFNGWDAINLLEGCPSDYCSRSGTSMAAPFVSGAAAVLWSVYPKWTPDQIVERLKKTAKPLPGEQLGAGRLDLFNAIFDGSFELSNNLVGWSIMDGSSSINSSIQKSWGSLSPTHGAQFALIQQDSDFAEKPPGFTTVGLQLSFQVKPETKSLSISLDYNVSLVNVKPRQLSHDELAANYTFYGSFTIKIDGPNGKSTHVAGGPTNPLHGWVYDDKPFEPFEPGKWKKAVVNINTAGNPGFYTLIVTCEGNRQLPEFQAAGRFWLSAEACAVALDNVVLGGQ